MGKEERSASMITVFHGGVDIIENPRTDMGRKNLDFGFGFYVTRRLQQAEEWAGRTARQMLETPVVNEYAFDIESVKRDYRYYIFERYDSYWLHFIVACRKGYDSSKDFDCVEGGVANDRVVDTIEGFMNGTIDEAHALAELSKHQPNNQICILNQEIIDKHLTFIQTVQHA